MTSKLDEIRKELEYIGGKMEHGDYPDRDCVICAHVDKALAALDSLGSESARDMVGKIGKLFNFALCIDPKCPICNSVPAMLEAWYQARKAKESVPTITPMFTVD